MKLKTVIAENFEWKPIKYLCNITSWKVVNALLDVLGEQLQLCKHSEKPIATEKFKKSSVFLNYFAIPCCVLFSIKKSHRIQSTWRQS
jgi:hypothetical protein